MESNTNTSTDEQRLNEVLAHCRELEAGYAHLGTAFDRQQRIIALLTSFLAGLAVTLLSMGLSLDCANEINLLLAGLATAATIFLLQTREEDPDPPQVEPVEK